MRVCTLCLLLSLSIPLIAQSAWSDANSWPTGQVPTAGQDVTIPSDSHIVLDVETPDLGGVTVSGKLSFAETTISLTADYLLVEGQLEAGTENKPYAGQLTITLNGPDEDVMGMGSRCFGTMNGGGIELHGSARNKRAYTKIAAHAFRGATTLELTDDPTEWAVGDHIVIAPSGFLPFEAEELTITAVNGRNVSFTPALKYNHWGTVQTYHGRTLDERAEVAILSRNIIIQGPESSVADGFGAHGMIMAGSAPVHVEGVLFQRMGQPGRAARYSWHWHLAGDRAGDYIRDCTVRDALQRGYVVHGTDNVLVENNVAYNVTNHAFIPAEDGNEMGNRFIGNIAVLTRKVEKGYMAFPHGNHPETMSNQGEHRASAFWLRNVHNPLIGNVAAGVEKGAGFFYDTHGRHRDFRDFDLLPQPIIFQDNVAHSCWVPGVNNNAGTNVALYSNVGHGFGLFIDNFYLDNDDVAYRFDNFLAYKNSMSGIWNEETNVLFTDMILADNTSAFVTGEGHVENSLVIGQSADTIGGRNRVLRHGHQRAGFYTVSQGGKKRPRFDGVTFVNMDEGTTDAFRSGAFIIDYHLDMRSNYTQNLTFDNSVAANFETMGAISRKPSGAMLFDRDGSLTGLGEPRMLMHTTSPLWRDDCDLDDRFRAYTCPADKYLNIDIPRIKNVRFRFFLDQENGKRVHDGGLNHRISRMRVGETNTVEWDNVDKVPDEYALAFHPHGTSGGDHGFLRIPYPYPGVTLRDHNDELIPRGESEAIVRNSNRSAFYFDPEAGVIFLKSFATGVGDEEGKDWVHIAQGNQDVTLIETVSIGAARLLAKAPVLYPNPISAASGISYSLTEAATVSVSLTDVLGRGVRTVYSGQSLAGAHRVGLGNLGLPAGIYFIRLAVNGEDVWVGKGEF